MQVRRIVVSHDVAVLSYCILSYSQSLDVSIMSNEMRLSIQYELLIKAVWLIQRQSLTMCDSREVASMANRAETLGQLSTIKWKKGKKRLTDSKHEERLITDHRDEWCKSLTKMYNSNFGIFRYNWWCGRHSAVRGELCLNMHPVHVKNNVRI